MSDMVLVRGEGRTPFDLSRQLGLLLPGHAWGNSSRGDQKSPSAFGL